MQSVESDGTIPLLKKVNKRGDPYTLPPMQQLVEEITYREPKKKTEEEEFGTWNDAQVIKFFKGLTPLKLATD